MPELATEQAIENESTTAQAIQTETAASDWAKSDEELVGLEPEPYRAEYKSRREQVTKETDSKTASSDESEVPRADEESATVKPLPESLTKAMAAAPEVKAEL